MSSKHPAERSSLQAFNHFLSAKMTTKDRKKNVADEYKCVLIWSSEKKERTGVFSNSKQSSCTKKNHPLDVWVINIPFYFTEIKNKHQQTAVDVLPVCEVGVRGVGGATSCVPLGLPELEGIMPRAAGFRPCRNLSSRSLRSLSGSSAALFAPWTAQHIINKSMKSKRPQ